MKTSQQMQTVYPELSKKHKLHNTKCSVSGAYETLTSRFQIWRFVRKHLDGQSLKSWSEKQCCRPVVK